MISIRVNVKSAATKKNKIQTVTVPYDEHIADVKGLLEATVAWCVDDYNRRRQGSGLLTAFSPEQIEDKASEGKVSFGVNYGEKDADLSKATADALEAFSDGVVVVFADDRRLHSLDEIVDLTGIHSLTFVRLTMLAGRIW